MIKRVSYFLIICIIGVGIGIAFLAGCGKREVSVDVNVSARSAVIIEAKSGEVLYEKDADKRYPPASTAKLMTAVVAIERMPLNRQITPSKTAVKVEPTVAGLKPGVRYKLEDLVAAILIKSANDAAVVIAEGVAGSEEKFTRLMNAKARKLGMNDTYFATASGLPTGREDSQYTTSRDLSKLMKYALRHKVILDKMSQKETDIYGSDKERIYLKTHNKSLFRTSDAPWGKTGYTREAKRTFTGVDPSMKPRVAFALLKSDDLWNDITTLKDQGLYIYDQRRKTFLTDLIDWIRSQRERGRESLAEIYALHIVYN